MAGTLRLLHLRLYGGTISLATASAANICRTMCTDLCFISPGRMPWEARLGIAFAKCKCSGVCGKAGGTAQCLCASDARDFLHTVTAVLTESNDFMCRGEQVGFVIIQNTRRIGQNIFQARSRTRVAVGLVVSAPADQLQLIPSGMFQGEVVDFEGSGSNSAPRRTNLPITGVAVSDFVGSEPVRIEHT